MKNKRIDIKEETGENVFSLEIFPTGEINFNAWDYRGFVEKKEIRRLYRWLTKNLKNEKD